MPPKQLVTDKLDTGCACGPPVDAKERRIACVLCKKAFHAACVMGLDAAAERAFRDTGDDFVCRPCHAHDVATMGQGKVRKVPAGAAFGCCGAELCAGIACWPCAGAGCGGSQWYHAACLGVTDGGAIAAMALRGARYYCAKRECKAPPVACLAKAGTAKGAKPRKRTR
jgi:hypothetical protein